MAWLLCIGMDRRLTPKSGASSSKLSHIAYGSKTPDLKESYKIMKKSILVIAGALAFALAATATDIRVIDSLLWGFRHSGL